jgi:hypothetical protein
MLLPDVFADTSNIPEVAGLYRAAISTASDAPFNTPPQAGNKLNSRTNFS